MTASGFTPVYRQVLAHARAAPEKAAIKYDEQSISYAALASRVHAVAEVLAHDFGVSKGDRIVLLADSNADFICAYFAVHSIGAICVPLDPNIAEPRFAAIVERVAPRLIVSENVMSVQTGDWTFARFEELSGANGNPASDPGIDVVSSQTADILFTTGTTGQPKGVVLSHRALAVACAHINAFIGIGGDAIEVLPLPLSHSFGLGRVRCVLSAGATLVLTRGFMNGASLVNAFSKHGATGFASVPTGIAILLGNEGSALNQLASQLEYIEIGSASMATEDKKHLMRLLPKTRICMHYGLTEASRSAYISFHDDAGKLESIGKPSPDVEMRIVDESGDEVDIGVQGHIEIRGGHLMDEYWHDPDLTAETMRNGWLRTGDVGSCDEHGYFYLKARSSDIINVGGRKVSPHEVEKYLLNHPAVSECACVGIPDPQGISGELISAFLVAEPNYGELPKLSELATLLRKSLEPYMIPRKFTWVGEIPKTSSGKILRQKLKNPG